LENAWYTASFFFATGCYSNWSMDENGEFVAVDDNFNSAAGMAAMKGMQKLAQSKSYDSNADIFTDAGVIITGIWNAEAAEAHFGENFAATDLPSFTVDGKTYHLGSYTGNKLMGVKPQSDAKRGAVLSLLAQWLTNEKCQLERYEKFQWGPSNKAAQASDAVQSNPSLAALAKQGEYGQPQGQIHGSWWDIGKLLGADAKNANSDADLQTALDGYKAAIDELFRLTPEQRRAWTVIGSVGNTNWDTDFSMTEGPDGTWTSVAIDMKAGNEFKVRQGLSWTNNFGVEFNGGNIVVEADGKYQVVFVWDGDKGATYFSTC
jgi:arabinogalactan oligomer/maltooligosaccharide transport system substrate-binding protein